MPKACEREREHAYTKLYPSPSSDVRDWVSKGFYGRATIKDRVSQLSGTLADTIESAQHGFDRPALQHRAGHRLP